MTIDRDSDTSSVTNYWEVPGGCCRGDRGVPGGGLWHLPEGRHIMSALPIRLMAGAAAVMFVVAAVALSVVSFRGDFARTVPITVISDRAGLVMNPDAKVKLLGVPVGQVSSIEELPDGTAALHLEMDPDQLRTIPTNVEVGITSSTVFGAKFVQLIPPNSPASQSLRAGQVLQSSQVTVEFNTIFERLSMLLSAIDPMKLNRTLGAISSAINGRGKDLGEALNALDGLLVKTDPSLANLWHDLETAPEVIGAYADASDDVVTIVRNATSLSDTIVEERRNIDEFLLGTTGLADIGNEVLTANGDSLANMLDLLVPTTALTSQYNKGLYCSLAGLVELNKVTPLEEPGITISIGFVLAHERYRYPTNLPKVAATGGPQCNGLPRVPFGTTPPYVVADVGADPTKVGTQGILLNADGLKQMLLGPLAGPPRNSTQIGQPG
ncbi:MCE family protein [Mycobacterium sp. 236(2023)]|uniref:MCE family protein n=1 Tax=Mycobacterium sp. 236(2023) TaxID=3038163 RepID=UPI0024155FB6|nr:MCE family protein [Mycobacterium sp. 236(2023)]MDG4667924.1 MCE family protein [Mycobacterium sp. 236(2023)]